MGCGVSVGVTSGVTVADGVTVAVTVEVGLSSGVAVGVSVALGVADGVAVGLANSSSSTLARPAPAILIISSKSSAGRSGTFSFASLRTFS